MSYSIREANSSKEDKQQLLHNQVFQMQVIHILKLEQVKLVMLENNLMIQYKITIAVKETH